jgi:hypothetical protein
LVLAPLPLLHLPVRAIPGRRACTACVDCVRALPLEQANVAKPWTEIRPGTVRSFKLIFQLI